MEQETGTKHKIEEQDYTKVPMGKCKSVKDIGLVEETNTRYRRTMEDGHVIIDGFRGKDDEGFFGIYDGHGGRTAVDHVQKTLHKNFEEALKESTSVKEAFVKAYKKTDKELKDLEILYNGTTAVTCYIAKVMDKDKGQLVRKLFTANVGDARVVINRGGKAFRLSHDHKASDREEAKRITDSGGFVAYNRVNGILSVTRALGDHAMKEWVVCDPHYSEIVLNDKDQYLILACDGIWDVLTDQDAVDLIKDETSAQAMCEKLLKTALSKGSTDNISVMVLIF